MFFLLRFRPALLFIFLLGAGVTWAGITGSISGEVTDPSGALVPNATVAAVNTQTGVQTVVKSDAKGFYDFAALPIGVYDLEVTQPGFKTFRQTGLVIDANSALRLDVKLQLGEPAERIVVTSETAHVETQSTQMGEVIEGSRMTTVPLNGRSYTDLLSLQPGVVPAAYGNAIQQQFGGLADRNPSGALNAGNQSVNGQRQASNGFMIDGANVEEGKNNGAAIVPNLDSIAEFRIITNNFDAEYGNYSGGQINVATKSGSNHFHGSAFEFLRNTVLDARNFFDTTGVVPEFKQNQFGGTGGGPLKKDKLFFFGDYQGTRSIIGQPVTGQVVPGLLDRPDTAGLSGAANVSDVVSGSTSTVTGANWAAILFGRLGGQPVNNGEAYFGCSSPGACVFPNNIIPARAVDPVALKLLQFIPLPNSTVSGVPAFNSSSFNETLRDDKGGIRVDENSRFGMISGYYSLDDFTRDDPFPNITLNGIGGGPGFDSNTNGRSQLINLSDTKSFGFNSLNEFRFSFVRTAGAYFVPKGHLGTTLTSLGFVPPSGTGLAFNGGIAPVSLQLQDVPEVSFNNLGLAIGSPFTTTHQFNNMFQWQDNFTKVIGTHSLKFGGQTHWDQINERNFFAQNGAFTFDGSETGNDYVDFLLGAPVSLTQASEQFLDSRTKYFGLYGQDSWRAKPSLTLNYGLRWEVSQPWYDTQNKTETIVPGEQSVVFPGAPLGWLVPGDPGIPTTLAPTRYNNFAPRIGLAYSPGVDSGFLAKLTGGPGKMSIRTGFGIYYTAIEDLSQFLEVGDPPYGLFYGSPAPPLFDQPFITRADGSLPPSNQAGGPPPFPFIFPPANVSASHPDKTFNWAQVEPISFGYAFFHKNRLPYAEHFELSLQRQFGAGTILTTSYVGTEGHRLLTLVESNPGITGLCNQLNTLGASPPCGPNGENTLYTIPPNPVTGLPQTAPAGAFTVGCPAGTPVNSVCVPGTRTVLNPLFFGNNPFVDAMSNSVYHSLQVSLRHTSRHASLLVGYTFSKSLDNASSLQDFTNPFNYKLSRSLSAFDVRHNFVASYTAKLPFDMIPGASSGWASRVADGWQISGITTFATGLPVTLEEFDDTSGTGGTDTMDLPNIIASGKILKNTNPRNQSLPYFNTSLFGPETAGCATAATGVCPIGNANRRFFHGPGINNWDLALLKDTKITESKSIQFRFEAFNTFNHAQFGNPDSNVLSSTFGLVTGTIGTNTLNNSQGRVLQAALKFLF